MTTFRIERINRELLRRISDLIRTRIKDDTLKEAVLSEVSCSKDLSHAKVYFRALTPGSRENVEVSLNRTAGVMRSMLGKSMRLRQVPELHFIYDATEDRAQAIEDILDSLDLPEVEEETEDAGC
ncbi:MAG: 30S ribosome-binding factor RbfA [Thermovirga sp.]|jgi:ribosome-binding factor A|nr:30S ribosome-binding factor RbfA [Thermovirga sp.]